jgi:hypothetical protein
MQGWLVPRREDDGGEVGVALNRDKAGRDRVHGDTGWGEFAGLAEGQAYLRALGCGLRAGGVEH